MIGTAAGLLRSVGSMFGGMLGTVGNSAYAKQHDTVLKEAIDGGKLHFYQCHRCGHWICPEVCWNSKAGLCNTCAPDETLELTAQKAPAESAQTYTKVRETSDVGDLDFGKNKSEAFGKNGAMVDANAKFCSGCGAKTG